MPSQETLFIKVVVSLVSKEPQKADVFRRLYYFFKAVDAVEVARAVHEW
jgi:hypothetical protein